MKNSNKIIIGFAVALILIPLLGMIYVSQVKYKVGDYTSERNLSKQSERHFNTPTEDMESRAISTAFESINIEDAKRLGVYINFIKDDNYGVKVPNELKDSINFKVDGNGQLQITFNTKGIANRRKQFATIFIYGKNMKQVNISNAHDVFFDAIGDSLKLNIRKSNRVGLNNDVILNSLSITTNDVEGLDINKIAVKSLLVNLNGTNFNSNESSYDNLSITTTGRSEIDISGSDEDNHYFIKNLFINTLGSTAFKLANIKVSQCSGNFSDQTKVEMPAINLKQMFKK